MRALARRLTPRLDRAALAQNSFLTIIVPLGDGIQIVRAEGAKRSSAFVECGD